MENLNVEQIYLGTMAFIVILIVVLVVISERFKASMDRFDKVINEDYYDSFTHRLSDNNSIEITENKRKQLRKRYIELASKKLNKKISKIEDYELHTIEMLLEDELGNNNE